MTLEQKVDRLLELMERLIEMLADEDEDVVISLDGSVTSKARDPNEPL